MGGYGSGRHESYSTKSTVEECYVLDINWMIREGLFDGRGWRSGSIRWSNSCTGKTTSSIGYELNIPERWIRLHYRRVRDGVQLDYKNPLTTTELPWGGVRWWFACALSCNGRYCRRRVGKLYLPPGGRYYGCRHCYDLTYASCRESRRPSRLWSQVGDTVGMSAYDMKRLWDDDFRWEMRMERQAKRNEQRRRRRKAKNWT